MKEFIRNEGFCLLSFITIATALTYSVDTQNGPLTTVSDKFVSVALDCSNIEGRFDTFNLTDPNLAKLVKHLSPMYFRIGGTYADRIIFSEGVSGNSHPIAAAANITFLGEDWLKLYQFTKNADVRLIFDLNSLLRNGDGTWNSDNAEKMIRFSQENGIETDWELGNEPDLYNALYQTHVDATQLGNDFKTLRSILNDYELYKSSYLLGADMFDVGGSTANQDYLSQFLKSGSEAIHAVTWHQYYFPGKGATEAMFLEPATFNYLEQRTNVVKNVLNKAGATNKIWLGETSSAYNGGAADMSNRFLATFLWLDKLGLGAKLGIDVIIRQTIFHDYYALLDDNYNPNPDWWLSVLYKRLVGPRVVSVDNDGGETRKIRLYAHCAQKSALWDDSAVVVFGINVDSSTGSFDLNDFDSDNDVRVYEFTSESSLYSQSVRLNGEVLNVTPEYNLPDLQSKIIEKSKTYTMPPYSIVFWVFSNTNVEACKTS